MTDTGFPVIRQDVRRELAHGHELDHELREMERLAERALSPESTRRESERAMAGLKKRASRVAGDLRAEGYDDLAEYVKRATRDVEKRRRGGIGGDSLPSELDFSEVDD